MSDEYKNSNLWKQSLGLASKENEEQLERLRTAYLHMREKVKQLTSHIAGALPGLTIHDVTHLDALWETADLLAGDSIKLNPLEGFILGAAVLLHDSALCFEAYEGGEAGLRAKTCWKDSKALEAQRSPGLSELAKRPNQGLPHGYVEGLWPNSFWVNRKPPPHHHLPPPTPPK